MSKTLNKKFNTDLNYVYSDNDTLSIIFKNNEVLFGVVGEFNNNIKELENITKTFPGVVAVNKANIKIKIINTYPSFLII